MRSERVEEEEEGDGGRRDGGRQEGGSEEGREGGRDGREEPITNRKKVTGGEK
jgi:hypothetical protein